MPRRKTPRRDPVLAYRTALTRQLGSPVAAEQATQQWCAGLARSLGMVPRGCAVDPVGDTAYNEGECTGSSEPPSISR